MTVQPLWSVEAMATAMRAERRGTPPSAVSGISIDTRTIAPGEAFFAITGDNRDGHAFVAAALSAGAALAVVSHARQTELSSGAPLLVVPDVLAGLRDLATAARRRSPARIIGVTGSVGKTGTKEALRLVLAEQGETHASAASYNNHWGVPLSLARCPQSARYAVFEMGMNHAGEIEPLTRLVRPHVAIITAIEPVHLEFLGTVEAIADAKAEIFRGLEPGGVAVINRDSRHYGRLAQRAREAEVGRLVSFGEHVDADVRLLTYRSGPDASAVEACVLGADISYVLGAPGRHVVLNSLAVLAAVALVGADPARAARRLAGVVPASGRGARVRVATPGGDLLLIDESYNANPASMRAALALLGQAEVKKGGRRIAVLGDMLELGPQGADLHRSLVETVEEQGVDLVFCCGPLMHMLWEALPSSRRGAYSESSSLLEPRVLAAIRPGDAVMVKGSLGSRMAPIVKSLQSRGRAESTQNVSITNG
ncbi:MAG: UDP-N-acetylmuramoylalanyl-D-glutamyl-2,6-diaminopimelate--D-alanyl-D-alanine ligase [Hyphomicrobiales bacterium]|nr:UDP-N-acetylmuramoylalanyl-D-glutamyl-2,6-diaminopimelate--D-alanyl-D-alanine ligase [Hyphomicrobiales bacterium]